MSIAALNIRPPACGNQAALSVRWRTLEPDATRCSKPVRRSSMGARAHAACTAQTESSHPFVLNLSDACQSRLPPDLPLGAGQSGARAARRDQVRA